MTELSKFTKRCEHCNMQFETNNKRMVLCSDECRKRRAVDRNAARRRGKDRPLRKCIICETEFAATTKSRTCSAECKEERRRESVREGNERTRQKRREENNRKYADVLDIPTCKICGWKSRSLSSHLRNHKMTVEEYRERYGVTNEDIFHSTYTDDKSERVSGENNPGWQHGGTMSSFSKNFRNYEGMTEEEKEEAIGNLVERVKQTKEENHSYTTTLEYYTSRGYTLEEAEILRFERQTTFSLDICIEKYGEEEGKKRWLERQEKWLNSDGVKRMKQGYSLISQRLFDGLMEHYNDPYPVYYATNGDDPEENNERTLRTKRGVVKIDFFAIRPCGSHKIIEFDGDYWHSEDNPYNICDVERDAKIMEAFPKYQILHVYERDFKSDPEGTIEKCLEFLRS